jgi:transcriptional regulator with XRE-family HTH domain
LNYQKKSEKKYVGNTLFEMKMAHKKYTQTELAKRYGVSQPYISMILKTNPETGKNFESKSEYQKHLEEEKNLETIVEE